MPGEEQLHVVQQTGIHQPGSADIDLLGGEKTTVLVGYRIRDGTFLNRV